jgi:hypothetical protein
MFFERIYIKKKDKIRIKKKTLICGLSVMSPYQKSNSPSLCCKKMLELKRKDI